MFAKSTINGGYVVLEDANGQKQCFDANSLFNQLFLGDDSKMNQIAGLSFENIRYMRQMYLERNGKMPITKASLLETFS